MIELIIEPAPLLINTLMSKTTEQLIEIVRESKACERIASIAIHLTAIEILIQRHPDDYEAMIK